MIYIYRFHASKAGGKHYFIAMHEERSEKLQKVYTSPFRRINLRYLVLSLTDDADENFNATRFN